MVYNVSIQLKKKNSDSILKALRRKMRENVHFTSILQYYGRFRSQQHTFFFVSGANGYGTRNRIQCTYVNNFVIRTFGWPRGQLRMRTT